MKKFAKNVKQAAQGDILVTRITTLPASAVASTPEDGKHIVAHSETGHHHVMDCETAVMYDDAENELVSYLVIENSSELTHTREYNTHESVEFDQGVYRINRQREYTPEGYRRVAD